MLLIFAIALYLTDNQSTAMPAAVWDLGKAML